VERTVANIAVIIIFGAIQKVEIVIVKIFIVVVLGQQKIVFPCQRVHAGSLHHGSFRCSHASCAFAWNLSKADFGAFIEMIMARSQEIKLVFGRQRGRTRR
jgi:hypothetical protein